MSRPAFKSARKLQSGRGVDLPSCPTRAVSSVGIGTAGDKLPKRTCLRVALPTQQQFNRELFGPASASLRNIDRAKCHCPSRAAPRASVAVVTRATGRSPADVCGTARR
jgi:hypothetical protein